MESRVTGGGRRGRQVPEGMGLPAGRDPRGLGRRGESDLWERRDGGALGGGGRAAAGGQVSAAGDWGAGWRERRVWRRGGGCGTVGYAAGMRPVRGEPGRVRPPSRAGTGCTFPPGGRVWRRRLGRGRGQLRATGR